MALHVQKNILENGVRMLSERVDGVRSVSVGVLVDVGPKDEQPLERGYAHLVEHMLFQGTGARDAGEIAEMMEIGGGVMGAFTARDYTVYHATVLDEYLPFALEVLGDMLCNSVIAEDALDRQRSVILNEIAGQDDPLSHANDLLKETLWPDHPLGSPTAGVESTILGATRQTLRDFMQRHYVAPRIVVAAAGNVSDYFDEQVRDSFWRLPSADSPPAPLPPPVAQSATVIAAPRDLQQVYFALAWPAPSYVDPERYAWHVFSTLFGGSSTSRLYRRLREEQGLVFHISAQYQAYGTAGALVVEGSTSPNALVPVLAGTLIELYKLAEDTLSPDDLHRAAQSLISQHHISGDSAYVRMSRLALQELYFRGAVPSEQIITGLRSQSPRSIQQVALNAVSTGLPTMALVGPVTPGLLDTVGSLCVDFGQEPKLIYTSHDVPTELAPAPVDH